METINLINIPFSAGGLGKTSGVEKGPEAIVSEMKDIFTSEEGKVPSFDISSVEVDNGNIEKTNTEITLAAESSIRNGKSIFLGGDHSITYSLVKGFAHVYPDNPGIVIFDAHPDACTDFNPPTHEDLLLALVKEKIIAPANIVLVGIRNMHQDEVAFLKEHKIKVFTMKEISSEGIREVSESVMSIAKDFGSLYVSLDIDVLDPAYAPGTGYIEPGGMSTRDLLFFIHRLKKLNKMKAADVVEVNPTKDFNGMTAKAAAKLVVELV